MDSSGEFDPSDSTARHSKKPRARPVNACATCRARKVKCDERPNGCLNCERLQLTCVSRGNSVPSEQSAASQAITGIKRKRTFRVCIPCRQSKIKCAGERPVCSRCQQRNATCSYDAEAAEPAWIHNVPTTPQLIGPDVDMSSASSPQRSSTVGSLGPQPDYPPSLAWLFAQEIPPKPKLHSLLDAYFNNVHPIRVFAFVHKPSFMRMLDESIALGCAERALLLIMLAHGAKFYALEYSESTSGLSRKLVHMAGSQWAELAQKMHFAEWSTISVTKLKVLVLLHDHEARLGNYAGSFLLTGLIVRMAHALQIHTESSNDILYKDQLAMPNEVSLRECRRRLMWACYMVDVWAGSGVDQLTILNEKDIKLQLPCNERQFLLQIATVTECLQPGQVLPFVPRQDVPEKPHENMGMSAYFVRIASIWKRVLRYIKHLDKVQPPWVPGAEFANLYEEIEQWKRSLPSWLEFSPNNIYIRRESSQLGALFIIHCMYHHVLCDLHRISLPNLFKIREPFVFPPEKNEFMTKLQAICFEHAKQLSMLTSTILQYGVKFLADPILPSFIYNSNRVMLYYIARILDRSKHEARTVAARTIELVELNIQALRAMSRLYPLAEPLYITTERWLDKVRESITHAHATTYIAPEDPVDPDSGIDSDSSSTDQNPAARDHDVALLMYGPLPRHINERPDVPMNIPTPPVTNGHFGLPSGYSYPVGPLPSNGPSDLLPMQSPLSAQPGQMGMGYYPGMENAEQPMFDLNDLQNFFEWEYSENGPPPTGVEGLGPLGWDHLSNLQ